MDTRMVNKDFHNSHRPLDRFFALFWPRDLNLWPFDLILIDGRGIVMNYPVPSLVIVLPTVLVLSCGQTHAHTEWYTDAANRYTHVTRLPSKWGVNNSLYHVCENSVLDLGAQFLKKKNSPNYKQLCEIYRDNGDVVTVKMRFRKKAIISFELTLEGIVAHQKRGREPLPLPLLLLLLLQSRMDGVSVDNNACSYTVSPM